jgi:hypothetical protein
MSFFSKFRMARPGESTRLEVELSIINQRLERLQEAVGRIENRQLTNNSSSRLSAHEYRVFSQWGEDGIIQFLLRRVRIDSEVFVEFGVGDYSEANTRFLSMHNNWTGLVMDASAENIERVKSSAVCWRHGLTAVQSFITRDNINQLITAEGISGEIGLLSIDIDGNDYWVWEAIESVKPTIVIVEYNHRFGSELAVTIPYDENFRRGEQFPIIYFGASLAALCVLAERKGYAFVGCNSSGVNAFFVQRDLLIGDLRPLSANEGYVAGKFTENRDEHGFFIPASPAAEKAQLLNLPLVHVSS